jgi:HK97 family phage major capsid protein
MPTKAPPEFQAVLDRLANKIDVLRGADLPPDLRALLAKLSTDKPLDEVEGRTTEQREALGALFGPAPSPVSTRLDLEQAANPEWVRESDGRPAALGRTQRFADHEIVREHVGRRYQAEQAVIDAHGDLHGLVRSMTDTSGSALVPTVWASQIIDRARNLAAVTQAGATFVPMDMKTVQIGRLTTDPTGAFRTEGSTVTASDPVFDNVTLDGKTMSALVVGSMEWFQDAPNAGEVVTAAIAKAVALQLDLASLFGGVTTGAEQTATGNNMLPSGGLATPPNPRGILANLLANASSSVLGGAANGTPQTAATFWGEVIDTLYTPTDFNEMPNAMLWPSKLARKYAKAVDTQNNPMRVPPAVDAIPKFVTNQIPSGFTIGTGTLMSDLFVGDFRQLLIGQRLQLVVQVLTERYAELGQVAIICHWRGDVQLARPRAFAVYRYLLGT